MASDQSALERGSVESASDVVGMSVFADKENDEDDMMDNMVVGMSALANGGSAAKSLKTAINHFDKFVVWLNSQSNNSRAQALGATLVPMPYRNIKKANINYHVLDYFATYLTQNMLSYFVLASRYLSAIYNNVKDSLEKEGIVCGYTTRKIRRGLLKYYADKAAQSQTNLSKGHE